MDGIFIVLYLASLEPVFMSYLRPSDQTNILVSQVYRLGSELCKTILSHVATQANDWLDSLYYDEGNNLMGKIYLPNDPKNAHTIRLNHHLKPTRGLQRTVELDRKKENCMTLAKKIVDNIKLNVEDQNNKDTWYFAWSGLDPEEQLSADDRVSRLAPHVGWLSSTLPREQNWHLILFACGGIS